MTTFTASDGKRYRATGDFVPAKDGDYWYVSGDWTLRKNIWPGLGETSGPVIHVTPVEPEYDVTVRLSENQFKRYRDISADHATADWSIAIIDAIKAGKYTEVTE